MMSFSNQDFAPYKYAKGRSPVILHVPHSSTVFPKRLLFKETILNPQVDLRESAEIIADLHTEKIAQKLLSKTSLRPHIFEGTVSRLFFDPERLPDEREEMNSVGMGVFYENDHRMNPLYSVKPSDAELEWRHNAFYLPYRDAFEEVVDSILYDHGKCLIVDVHSYCSSPLDYELHREQSRDPLVLGYDNYHIQGIRPSLSEIRKKFYVSSNTVFKGSYVPLKHYLSDSRVSSVMFEMRKDTYMDESTGALLGNGNGKKHSPYVEPIEKDILSIIEDFINP